MKLKKLYKNTKGKTWEEKKIEKRIDKSEGKGHNITIKKANDKGVRNLRGFLTPFLFHKQSYFL